MRNEGGYMFKLCILADADSIHTRKWVDYFTKYTCEIHLISMRGTKYTYGKNVHLYVVEPKGHQKFNYLFIIKKIKSIVKEIKPDILHSHYATSYGLFGRMCSYHPFVVSVWGSDINEFPNQGILNKKILQNILKSCDAVCATSNSLANRTSKYCDDNISITPFGVDLSLFKNSIPVLSNNYITIGIVKNLEKVYAHDILIQAFSQLVAKFKDRDFRLLIVGEGSERKKLMELSKELGIINKVTFTGHIDNNSVANYVNKMDIVCIPSLFEGFGVSAVEACACGRPVIASNVGGLKEIIRDGYNGYLVEPSNVIDLQIKLEKMLGDRNKLIEFSQNALKVVKEKYNWEQNAEEMWKVYDRFGFPKGSVKLNKQVSNY